LAYSGFFAGSTCFLGDSFFLCSTGAASTFGYFFSFSAGFFSICFFSSTFGLLFDLSGSFDFDYTLT
jgi:hypothetical protein